MLKLILLVEQPAKPKKMDQYEITAVVLALEALGSFEYGTLEDLKSNNNFMSFLDNEHAAIRNLVRPPSIPTTLTIGYPRSHRFWSSPSFQLDFRSR